jgi:aspartate aminotransferase
MPVQELVNRLMDVRYAMGGLNFQNEKIHPSIRDDDVLSFADGNGMRRPHSSIFGAAVDCLLDSTRWSPDNYMLLEAHDSLEEAALRDMRSMGLTQAARENLVVGLGTTHIFNIALRLARSSGDTVLTPRSYYHELPNWCLSHNLELEIVPTTVSTAFKLHPDTLIETIDNLKRAGKRPGILVIFNPTHTGAVYSPEELRDLALEVERQALFVIEDCVFAGIEFPGHPGVQPLCGNLDADKNRFVALRSVSKTYNMPNLRIGYACGDRRSIFDIRGEVVDTLASVPWLNQSLAAAAMNAPRSYVLANSRECATRAATIESATESIANEIGCIRQLDEPPIRMLHPPRAGHGALIKFAGDAETELGSTASVRIARSLLRMQKLAVGPASSLGFTGEGEVRIEFASVGLKTTYRHTQMVEAVTMLKAVTNKIGQQNIDAAVALEGVIDSLESVRPAQEPPADKVLSEGRGLIEVGMNKIRDYLLAVYR